MALAVACLRPPAGGPVPEAIVPEPAFEIFRFDTAVAGGRARAGDAEAGLRVPARRGARRDHAGHARRLPDEPEQPDRRGDAARGDPRRSRGACRTSAVVFVDEAYADFAGATFIPELPAFPNVVVGRTFSKAYGLAGLRIGCLVGAPDTLDPIRRGDARLQREHRGGRRACRRRSPIRVTCEDYLRQVAESKALLYAACDRLGLTYWPSDGELRAGPRRRSRRRARRRAPPRGASTSATARPSPAAPAASASPPASSSTRAACIAAMEEVLCAAR